VRIRWSLFLLLILLEGIVSPFKGYSLNLPYLGIHYKIQDSSKVRIHQPIRLASDSGESKETVGNMAQSSSVQEIESKSFNLPPGIRNPKGIDPKLIHSFSEELYMRQLKDKKATLWINEVSMHEYDLMAKNTSKMGAPIIQNGNPRKIRARWILVFILIIILILTFIKLQFPNDLHTLQNSLFNDRLIRDDRELRFLRSPSSILTLFAFCFSFAMLAYFYFRDQNIQLPFQGIELYIFLTVGLLLFFIFKIFILWLVGIIFNLVRVIQSYLSLNYIAMANFTIFISPFLLIYALNKSFEVHYLSVWIPFLVVVFFAFLYIRSIIFILSNYRFSKFYLFLYFCAVEICPLLLVFKVIYA